MIKTIDYYFSLESPWTYLGAGRFDEIADRHGAAVAYKPADARVIFPRTGGLPVKKRAPERQAYRLLELRRWSAHLGVDIVLEPKFFPVPETLAAHMVVAAKRLGLEARPLVNAILRACWAEERDVSDPATLEAVAGEQGLDGGAILAAAEDAQVAAEYEANSEEALARGVFGFPAYLYRDELFWGQDRLDFLDRALAQG